VNARALLRKKGALTLSQLAEAIAGEPIKGSWWSHPKGKLIFNVTSALEDAPGVLACKLGGRVTFVDESLFPSLYRVVTDEAFRAKAPPKARAIAKRAARGAVKLSALEKRALGDTCILHISSEHTDSGSHATFARTWESWASAETKRAATKLEWDDAVATLAKHGLKLL
jgi:hypothetical protein